MLGVVVSRADSASEHVGEHLLDIETWTEHTDGDRRDADGGDTVYRTGGIELREFDALHLDIDRAADAFGSVADGPDRGVDLLAFASRHAGETGPLLSAHHTGNLGPAEYGGADGALARACPNAHRRVLAALEEHAPPDYGVATECTHHGPSEVGAPAMFVEVGSDQAQWDDPEAARAVARAILDLRGVAPDAPPEDGTRRHVVGIGGGHYAPRFGRVARETDWAVGHVAADWGLDAMGDPRENRGVIAALFEESAASIALVDGDYPDVEAVVDELGYETVGETWLRETTGVALGLVDRLEDRLCPVAEGLRFGDRAAGYEGSFGVVAFPTALVEEAEGIDREATRAAVEGATLAFETVQNGTRLDAAGRAAVPADGNGESDSDAGLNPETDPDPYQDPDGDQDPGPGAGGDGGGAETESVDPLVDALVAVLESKYGTVERVDGAVLARERAFDPERARELGVPEGPKFGDLSAGRPVDVDGERIDPDDVHVVRERRFPVAGGARGG